MWFLRIAEEPSLGLNIPVEDSSFVLSPCIPDCLTLLSEALYLRLEVSRGTTIAAVIGQAVVDLNPEVK